MAVVFHRKGSVCAAKDLNQRLIYNGFVVGLFWFEYTQNSKNRNYYQYQKYNFG